jgi:hypothetical protein
MDDNYTFERTYLKLFIESDPVQVMGINKIATNDDPYSLYLFYLIPSQGYRGKVLNFKIDAETGDA